MTNSTAWRRRLAAAVFLICASRLALAVVPDETPPTTPPSFTATVVSPGTTVNLSWGTSTDNKGVTGYWLWRCQNPCTSLTSIATLGSTARSFTDTGRSEATTYLYEVAAVDAAGNQSDPAAASVTTWDLTAPSVPNNLAATPAGGSQINLTWSASSDNVGVTGYIVAYCVGAGCSNFAQLATTSSPGYSATSLSSATSYSFEVLAYDARPNYGGYSNIASATTADTSPPSAPATLSANAVSGTQIDLSWPAATDNVAVSGYLVERCSGVGCANFAQIAGTGSTSYSATGLSSSTSYTFRVRAYDAVPNYGSYSPVASATTPDVTPPTAPTSLTAAATSTTQINLSWPASTDDVGVVGYQVERCAGASCANFGLIGTSSSTSYSSGGLLPGNSYSFRVRAYDAVPYYGGYSPVATAITQGTPPPPNETITYEYDALGRLWRVTHSGTVNNGEQATYTLDATGNRSNVTIDARP